MAILIQSLERRDWSGLVSKIAVIVVFDDEGISFDRPFQKSIAAADRNRSSGGKLVGGHNIEQVAVSLGQGLYINAMSANGNRGNVISVLKENISHTVVSRLLVSDAMLGGRQQAADDFHGILCAGSHDDLIRRADDAPISVQNLAQLSAKLRISLVGFIANGLAVFLPQQGGVNAAPPCFPWKELGKYCVMFKIVEHRGGSRRWSRGIGRAGDGGYSCSRARMVCSVVQLAEIAVCHILHIVAGSGNRTDVSFCQKLLICSLNGIKTDAQFIRQKANRL